MTKIGTVLIMLSVMPAMANDYIYDENTYGDTYYAPDAPEYIAPHDTTATERHDNYIGMRIQKNQRIQYKYNAYRGRDYNRHNENFGFGLTVGNRLTNNIKIEFETAYTGASFTKYSTDFDYDMWSNMINAYVFREFSNAVAPYAGLGIGFTQIWSDVDTINRAIAHNSAFELGMQVMLGVNFALNNRVDLNIGARYQYFGKVAHSHNGEFAQTTIDATGIYFGLAYKFGLK